MSEFIDGDVIIISSHATRITTYDNLFIRNKSNDQYRRDTAEKKEKNYTSEVDTYLKIKKRKQRFKELLSNNFNYRTSVMVTCTFKPDEDRYKDLSCCYKKWQAFIKRINNTYDGFKYLAVYNRQKNGNWHYHMLCNLDKSVSQSFIRDLWGNGGVYISHLYSSQQFTNRQEYMKDNMVEALKYLYQNKVTGVEVAENGGLHGYLRSKNLVQNIKLMSWRDEDAEGYKRVIDFIKQENPNHRRLYSTSHVIGKVTHAYDPIKKESFDIITTDDEYTDEKMEQDGLEKAYSKQTVYTLGHTSLQDLFPEPQVAVYKGKGVV
jgi:hypothetical protein